MKYGFYTAILAIAMMLAAMICTGSGAAQAQLPVQSGADMLNPYDAQGVPYSNKYKPLLPVRNTISLFRLEGMEPDQFVLRIGHDFSISGCGDFGEYGYKASFAADALEIEITEMMMDMRNQPQYAHIECDTSSQSMHADIALSREMLEQNGTKRIRFNNRRSMNIYKVDLREHRVTLIPDAENLASNRRFIPANIPGRATALTYWFYPPGTVLLWIPDTKRIDDVSSYIESFARDKGLVPLSHKIPSFTSPLNDRSYVYFFDADNRLGSVSVNGAPVGTVQAARTIYGLHGDEQEMTPLTVFARTPGMFD